jgi:hypothetical protein
LSIFFNKLEQKLSLLLLIYLLCGVIVSRIFSLSIVGYFCNSLCHVKCRNPILRECEDETHTPEMGTWESSGTFKISEFDCKGQNTSHWGVLYIIGKLSKFKCRKWARMSYLDICSTSYDKKKGQESNWQFDSQP